MAGDQGVNRLLGDAIHSRRVGGVESACMDRRIRRRLMIIVVVLAVAFAAGVVWLVRSQGGYYRQVGELRGSELDDEMVRVAGRVVDGSIESDGAIQSFAISDLTGAPDTIEVVYEGAVPDTFAPRADVVVLGVYDAGAGLIRAEELQTKCPSKYEATRSPTLSPRP